MCYKYKDKEYHVFTKDNVHIAGKLISEGRTIGTLLGELEDDKQIEKQKHICENIEIWRSDF